MVTPPETMCTLSLARDTLYLQNVRQIKGLYWVGVEWGPWRAESLSFLSNSSYIDNEHNHTKLKESLISIHILSFTTSGDVFVIYTQRI